MCKLGCEFCCKLRLIAEPKDPVELRTVLHFPSHNYKVPPNTCHIALNLYFSFPQVSIFLAWHKSWYIAEYRILKPCVHTDNRPQYKQYVP